MQTIPIHSKKFGLYFPLRLGDEVIAYKVKEASEGVIVTLRSACLGDLHMSRAKLAEALEAEGWTLARSGVVYEDLAELCRKNEIEEKPILATYVIEKKSDGWNFLVQGMPVELVRLFLASSTKAGGDSLFQKLAEYLSTTQSKKTAAVK